MTDHQSDASVDRERASEDRDEEVVVERPEDDDYDLLTFGEAGARLQEELIRQQRRIERLRSAGGDDAAIAAAEQRLELLRSAAERNRKPTIDELRASGFFGPPDG